MIKKFFILMVLLCSVIFIKPAKADGANPLDVIPNLPSNQVNKEASWFDIQLGAGKEQELSLDLVNSGKEQITVDLSVNPALTNSNGLIIYSPSSQQPDSSLKYNLKDFLKGPEKVDVPAASSKKVTFKLKMPEAQFDGVIAGGINFRVENQAGSDSRIQSLYQYAVAVNLQESTKPVAPKLELQKIVSNQGKLNLSFQNPAMAYMNQLMLDLSLKAKDGKVYHWQSSKLEMAPNSNFDLTVPENMIKSAKESIPAGDYEVSLSAYAKQDSAGKYSYHGKQYDYSWNFKQTINISQMKEAVEEAVTLKPKASIVPWLIISGSLLVAVAIFSLLLLRNKKQNSQK